MKRVLRCALATAITLAAVPLAMHTFAWWCAWVFGLSIPELLAVASGTVAVVAAPFVYLAVGGGDDE